jgi:hypothetical protein
VKRLFEIICGKKKKKISGSRGRGDSPNHLPLELHLHSPVRTNIFNAAKK